MAHLAPRDEAPALAPVSDHRQLTARQGGRAVDAGFGAVRIGIWLGALQRRQARLEQARSKLDTELSPRELAAAGVAIDPVGAKRRVGDWLQHHAVEADALTALMPQGWDWGDPVVTEAVEDAAYAPYLARQEAELKDLRANDHVALPADFSYENVAGLSNEMVERLTRARPETLAAAARVPGITPAALAALLVRARRAESRAA